MKYLSSTLAVLLALVPAGLAQTTPERRDAGSVPAPRAHVTAVATSEAREPGLVEVRGSALELVTAARVNGHAIPLVANDGARLLLAPPPQVPGFGWLELVQPQDVLGARIEFTPSLSARWDDSLVRLRLHAGHGGWYVIHYSFKPLDEMIAYPGAYYGQMLDLSSPFSGVLFAGLAEPGPMDFPWMPIPRNLQGPGAFASGRAMRVQALCGGSDLCYSNMLTLQPTL